MDLVPLELLSIFTDGYDSTLAFLPWLQLMFMVTLRTLDTNASPNWIDELSNRLIYERISCCRIHYSKTGLFPLIYLWLTRQVSRMKWIEIIAKVWVLAQVMTLKFLKKGATEIVEGTYFGIIEEDYNFFSILSRTSATPLSTFLAVTRSNIFVSNLQQKE